MVAYTCKPSESESRGAGGSQVQGHSQQFSETLSQTKIKRAGGIGRGPLSSSPSTTKINKTSSLTGNNLIPILRHNVIQISCHV